MENKSIILTEGDTKAKAGKERKEKKRKRKKKSQGKESVQQMLLIKQDSHPQKNEIRSVTFTMYKKELNIDQRP